MTSSAAGGDVALDLDVLKAMLSGYGVETSGRLTAARVGHGQSNLTYVVQDVGGSRWIVRRPPRGHRLESAHDVVREARILSALGDTDVPVPRVLGRFDDPSLADTPVVVMEWVDGLVVDTLPVAESVRADVRRHVGLSLATTLARIHDVDLGKVGLADLASWSPYAERQLRRWSGQWESSRTRELPAFDRLTDLLRRTVPVQNAVSLVHGDFHIRNVLCDPATGDVRSVLDWELSTLGDPLADVGTLLAYWPEASDPPGGLFSASALPGFVGRDELAETYLRASGRDDTGLHYWHVLGLWKIAVIAEGIVRRARDQPGDVAEGGPLEPGLVEALVDRAWATAVASGLDR